MSAEAEADKSRWLREAGEELHAARTLLAEAGTPPRLVCFLAHLAAEKAIKALLVHAGKPVRRIHDLAELMRELPSPVVERLSRRDLEALTPWAIRARYVDDLAEADLQTALSALETAEQTLEVARSTIAPRGVS